MQGFAFLPFMEFIPDICASFSHTPILLFQAAISLIGSLLWTSLFSEFCSATLRFETINFFCQQLYISHLVFLLFSCASSQIIVWGYSHLLILSRKNTHLLLVFFIVLKLFLRRGFYFSSLLKEALPLIWFWNALFDFVLIFSFLSLLSKIFPKILCPKRNGWWPIQCTAWLVWHQNDHNNLLGGQLLSR